MKKIMMRKKKFFGNFFLIIILMAAILFMSACSQQKPDNLVGQGTPVEQQGQQTNTQPAVDVKEFKMIAKQFSFTPDTIEVNKGDKVRLIVTSTDIAHGIAITEYGINERLEPGKPVTIEFTADKLGTFTAYCSVFCGSGHSGMKGKLIVH